MSKLTEIEQALKGIDPAGFQRLCDAYLYAHGHKLVNPIGLVIGADKVKRGTPDSLLPLPNGNYAFAEYTTQETGVAQKLLGDIDKCFDEAKTGIPADRIQHILACHTSVLEPADEHLLVEEGRKRGCLITVYGLGSIAHDLYQRFPRLARDFLGVELDTGQILSIDDFVTAYGKNALATPLDTDIRCRDDEIRRGVEGLEGADLLIVAGSPGVGKSRLAVEICRRFVEKHAEVQPYAVLYRGLDLFRDVHTYFALPGSYLVLVDDANRVSGIDHILRLLHEQRKDRRIRLVITVREYALDRVKEDVRPYGGGPVLMLTSLKDADVRELVRADFGILNHQYLERIVAVSRGNPRLAVMAARVASKEQRLHSLSNVASLYDEYFSSIRRDISDLNDTDLVRVAGIVALFRHVDRKNERQIQLIADVFRVAPDYLWPAIQRLGALEVVDLYEDEVVRISDQVLATYLFYLAFFKKRLLDAAHLLHPAFFPGYRVRLFDALNPALNAFDGAAITASLLPALKERWAASVAANDDDVLAELASAFGPIVSSQTLAYVRARIEQVPTQPYDPDAFDMRSHAPNAVSLWTILGTLRNSELPVVRMAISLGLDLLTKRPSEAPHALHLLLDSFGIQHTSYLRDFDIQAAVVDTLLSRIAESSHLARDLYSRVFFAVAAQLLRTQFTTYESKTDLAISVLTFDVPPTPALIALRRAIWTYVAAALKTSPEKDAALVLLRKYSSENQRNANIALLEADAAVVVPALHDGVELTTFSDCAIVRAYLDFLKAKKVPLAAELDSQYRALEARCDNSTTKLAQLLFDDLSDRQERLRLGWEEYEALQQQELREFVARKDLVELRKLVADCVLIRDDLRAEQIAHGQSGPNHKEWQLRQKLASMFQAVAERAPALFVDSISDYLEFGDALELEPHGIVRALLACAGSNRTFDILSTHNYSRRGLWLSSFYAALPENDVSADRLSELLDHLTAATASDLFRDLDFLTKYEVVDGRVVARVVEVLVKKAGTDNRIGFVLGDLFSKNGSIGGRLRELFGGSSDDIALLQQAYFAASLGDPHFDYSASGFCVLLDLDRAFGEAWVDWRYASSDKTLFSRFDDGRDYSSLWLREDFVEVMRPILERICAHKMSDTFSLADAFFALRNGGRHNEELLARQKLLLHEWIRECAQDVPQMLFVFHRIAGLPHADRLELWAEFLARNDSLADFQKLPLEPTMWSWSGSEVPLLESRIAFLEGLLPLCDRIELLDHRLGIEQRISSLRKYAHEQRKRDFLER